MIAKTFTRIVLIATLIALNLVVFDCNGTITPTVTSITMVVNPNIEDVLAGQTVALSVDATGQNLRFKWSVTRGTLSAMDSAAVIYTAPDMPGVDTVTVEVSSASGTDTKSKSFKVVLPSTPTAVSTATITNTPTEPPVTPSVTPTGTLVVPTLTFTPPPEALCNASTSSELIALAWDAEEDPQKRLACTQVIIDRWTSDADQQQTSRLTNSICKDKPKHGDNTELQDFLASYWAVNDVATAWLLRGYALDSLGRTDEAKLAYQTVVNKYSCGFLWDPTQKEFWSLETIATDKLR
jgi:hypothetical protein